MAFLSFPEAKFQLPKIEDAQVSTFNFSFTSCFLLLFLSHFFFFCWAFTSLYFGEERFDGRRNRWVAEQDFPWHLWVNFAWSLTGLCSFCRASDISRKKSKFSRDFQGQIRGKIGRFRGTFAEESADFAGKKLKFGKKSADFTGF